MHHEVGFPTCSIVLSFQKLSKSYLRGVSEFMPCYLSRGLTFGKAARRLSLLSSTSTAYCSRVFAKWLISLATRSASQILTSSFLVQQFEHRSTVYRWLSIGKGVIQHWQDRIHLGPAFRHRIREVMPAIINNQTQRSFYPGRSTNYPGYMIGRLSYHPTRAITFTILSWFY
jgi:hypothetical protein